MLRPAAQFEEGKWTAWLLETLDEILPDSVTWDNELHFLLNFTRQETAFHVCHAFIKCHTKAQRKVTDACARRLLWLLVCSFPRTRLSGASRRRGCDARTSALLVGRRRKKHGWFVCARARRAPAA